MRANNNLYLRSPTTVSPIHLHICIEESSFKISRILKRQIRSSPTQAARGSSQVKTFCDPANPAAGQPETLLWAVRIPLSRRKGTYLSERDESLRPTSSVGHLERLKTRRRPSTSGSQHRHL